jgi:hypothetical protein|tara:strand:+ start:165 stop:1055 length:891 start_codon:yes stop_codon:yes gene_type:complete
MAKKTPPRKQRNRKNAAQAAVDASVEINSSNCSEGETLEAVNLYEFYGLGNVLQSYTEAESTDFATIEDMEKNTGVGKNSEGDSISLKDVSDIIVRSKGAGLPTEGSNYYFSTQQANQTGRIPAGGSTGSAVVNFIFGKNGPQAPYIPQLIHAQDGIATGAEYVFFLPAGATGTVDPSNGRKGQNMPVNHSSSFEITIAGACGAGESVQIYTASADGSREATGSAFTFSGSLCTNPNYSQQLIRILTSSIESGIPGQSQAGIVIAYTASYTADGTKENTPYAGIVVSVMPSALTTT